MLSVHDLVEGLRLELVAGENAPRAPIRWVHVSELADPTPWLSGGELLLTTGMQLDGDDSLRAYVRHLVDHQLAGLGFGTGFSYERLPDSLVQEARAHGFPLFEVPFEMPFIAVTERAFSSLVNEQYDLLQRSVAIHRRIERLVLEERGLDEVVRTLATAVGATVIVMDAGGHVLASHSFRREPSAAAMGALRAEIERAARADAPAPFIPNDPELAGEGLALPVPTGAQGGPPAWLAILREAGDFADFDRLIARHAVMVVALELMRKRIVRDTERRLAGDVLTGALSGRLTASELRARLAPFGIEDQAAVLVFALGDPAAAERPLELALHELGATGLVASSSTPRRTLLCAVVDPVGHDLLELAERTRASLQSSQVRDGPVRAAVGRPAPLDALRRSFHEARCALEVGALTNGEAPAVSSADDLGAYRLLLSLQDDDGLRLYCDDVLGPIQRSKTGNADELLRSLEAFLEHNGSWEVAARSLYCHRHTLRYRMARVEELTGRRLDRAQHRIEFWLALRGRELLSYPRGQQR
jgi:DNA-binding PucR family transcriptional regulator